MKRILVPTIVMRFRCTQAFADPPQYGIELLGPAGINAGGEAFATFSETRREVNVDQGSIRQTNAGDWRFGTPTILFFLFSAFVLTTAGIRALANPPQYTLQFLGEGIKVEDMNDSTGLRGNNNQEEVMVTSCRSTIAKPGAGTVSNDRASVLSNAYC